ncbi:uncharacterized protein BX664DRAFT_273355 [Halteromyces radiatus]|uniref:uncharacterized protein n=1 Tax=Halteromyces radiatus TaxID=101107 RepID=UPI00221E9B18|nr:uncharacterized protein BX664DRAFT_273355 [Halteromyces radiatus]KAI8099843.1 hypothetical protein BX664DRAFT_273355 [Halteromyces radiatus]
MQRDQNLERLRSTVMESGGREEKVEVNQRHLIDKILARYSAEYVLYRELMQNADDALSTKIEIHFHSTNQMESPGKLPNLTSKCHRITFKNNGMAFRPEDWQRLKRIAEGNPDEQKIGAFGVGFYSLFSVCENPFVFSGSQCMAFYFKGDQLFAKRADVSENERDDWTSFLMDLREPMEIPDLDHFAKFLTTSMGFTANLRQVSVYFDHHRLFNLTKQTADPRAMIVDAKKVHTSSPQRMFTIVAADMRKIQLDAEKYVPPSIFSPLTNLLSTKTTTTTDEKKNDLPTETASIFLRVVTGTLDVNVPDNFIREMERSTKKKPPKTTKFQLVYTSKEEMDASENKHHIFKDLMPFPNQGRVFIGFPTHQTTGCCSHMAARFIPTVERESIDFADRYLSIWNKELLSVGGLLSRLVYNDEMDQVDMLYRELVGSPTEVDKTINYENDGTGNAKLMLEQRAAHTLHSFTFQPSTPSDIVSKVQEERFYQSSRIPLRVMTSHGVQMVTVTRTLPDETYVLGPSVTDLLNVFIKTIPTTTPIVQKECKEGIQKLAKAGLLQYLGMMDVLKELDTRSLTSDEMVACMKWWIECNKMNQMIPATTLRNLETTRSKFFTAAVVSVTDGNDEHRLLQLANAKSWTNPKLISLTMPVPESTLPFSVSKAFTPTDLTTYFGLTELSLLTWGRFISNNSKLQTSPAFSEQVLSIITRGYNQLSSHAQEELCSHLKTKTCIPTKTGMKLPSDTYFTSVNLFDDLPIVQFQQPRHVGDQLLTMLGVRKHVDLQLVFDRLISDGSWSHVDLVKYLTSVQSTLSSIETRRLKETAIFTKEGEPSRQKEASRPTGKIDEEGKPIMEKYIKKVYRRHKASDLYAPLETLRSLQLPLIDWKGTGHTRWRQGSDEAKFMEILGLRSFPPLSDILRLASPQTNTDSQLQKRALTFFIENHQKYASEYDINKIDIAFLPCLNGKTYATPKNCFTNREVAVLNFQVLHQDLILVRDKLGVQENPSPDQLIQAFQQQVTTDINKMKSILEYMASRMGDFGYSHWEKLRNMKFIPVVDKRKNLATATTATKPLLVRPTECYFESDDANFHKELFLYVNFGSLANSFLRSCGVKDEPTILELASMLVKDPQRFWDLCGGGERYLTVLRQIAGQYYQIKNHRDLLQAMKTQRCLVGVKRSSITEDTMGSGSDSVQALNNNHDDDDSTVDGAKEEEFVQYRLAKASDIFINDDTMGQHIFSPLSAPMEPILEEFYANLGSDRLSNQIKETFTFREAVGTSARSKAIMDVIFERTGIIIYQMKQDYPQRQKELYRDENYIKRNLKVIQAKELRINRVFKHTGAKDIQPTTACVDRSKFIIYISSTGEIDYYDVANALCYLIFTRVRFNDAIIAERYLTTSLKNLRRKGVPVDRILSIKKTVENDHHQTNGIESSRQSSSSPPQTSIQPSLSASQLDEYTKQVLQVFSDCQVGYIRQLLNQEQDNRVERVIEKLLHQDYPRSQQHESNIQEEKPTSTGTDTLPSITETQKPQRLFDRILSWGRPTVPPTTPPRDKESSITTGNTEQQIPKEVETKPGKSKLPTSTQTITPNYTSSIQQNLRRAIHSCKPYSGQDMFSPPTINKVVESTQYCDETPGQNLTHVGRIKGIEFYVHRDVEAEQVLTQYAQPIQRFVHVVTGLANHVFELKLNTLHLYYDTEGPTIAFNKSGSLFLNLRYYLALHEPTSTTDPAIMLAKRKEALIYWYMTLAHELAHSFVHEHSAEHEFYFSSFAETYLQPLIVYMTSSLPTPSSPSGTPPSTAPDIDM